MLVSILFVVGLPVFIIVIAASAVGVDRRRASGRGWSSGSGGSSSWSGDGGWGDGGGSCGDSGGGGGCD